jgi:pSer/pThr/pTyr-binding forkhead associated (FHA) protein
MGMLQRFESRLEQAVSGAFAKAFRSAVQPVELAAALQREVDNSAQILSRNRRLVPNTFVIELSPVDHERLEPYTDTLTDELVEMLREHAEEQHYVFAGPVAIDFREEADLVTGRFRVRSQATAQVTPNAGRGRPAPTGAATVTIEVNGTRHPLTPPGLVIGRGAEADLRINDPGVSRRHAEFRVMGRAGTPEITVADLGSTNGTLVDGKRVTEAPVRDGSVVRIGSTDVSVRFARGEG